MRFSYSTRWLLCWILFVLALLSLVAGVFTLPNDWRQGLGLTLIGTGLAGPTAWWLHNASRNTHVHHIKVITWLGVILIISGAFLTLWKELEEKMAEEASGTHEKTSKSSTEDSPTLSSTNSPNSTSHTQTGGTVSPTLKSTPSEAGTEATVTVTEVETQVLPQQTVTEVETQVPPQVTVYSEAPDTLAPPQENNPGTRGGGFPPSLPADEPDGLAARPENLYPTPMENGDAQPQEQVAGEQQIPSGQDTSRNRNGDRESGEPSELFG